MPVFLNGKWLPSSLIRDINAQAGHPVLPEARGLQDILGTHHITSIAFYGIVSFLWNESRPHSEIIRYETRLVLADQSVACYKFVTSARSNGEKGGLSLSCLLIKEALIPIRGLFILFCSLHVEQSAGTLVEAWHARGRESLSTYMTVH